MEYKVNLNSQNVSTTADQDKKELQWSINDVYQNELSLDSLMRTLEVLDTFKRKYPDDETIKRFENIVRNEICMMFGGTLDYE